MAKYRKKPVLVDAVQFTQEMADDPVNDLPAGVWYTVEQLRRSRTLVRRLRISVQNWRSLNDTSETRVTRVSDF